MSVPDLPEYTIRRSPRAKHVRLRITPVEGLVVILPRRFDAAHVPDLLDAKRSWIDRKLATIKRIDVDIAPPKKIELKAPSGRVAARQTGNQLVLSGATEDHPTCRVVLKRWLARQAKLDLVPWLEKLSDVHDLPVRKIIVRGQKTRWGSCSSRHTISINYKLLFLEPHLVNHVLIHELCHIRHLNHSPAFWNLVEQFEPDHRQLDKRLRWEWEKLPGWVVQR